MSAILDSLEPRLLLAVFDPTFGRGGLKVYPNTFAPTALRHARPHPDRAPGGAESFGHAGTGESKRGVVAACGSGGKGSDSITD